MRQEIPGSKGAERCLRIICREYALAVGAFEDSQTELTVICQRSFIQYLHSVIHGLEK